MVTKFGRKNMKQNNEWEVLTPDGFRDFDGVQITKKDKSIKFSFSNTETLECSYNHKIDTPSGYVYSSELKVNDVVLSKNSQTTITNIEYLSEDIDLFDLINVDDKRHRFIANGIIVSNCAFVDSGTWSPFWTSIYPTISSSKTSRCIMVSTPNGLNHFYEFWRDAINGDNNFHPVGVNWWEVPLYAQNEYKFNDLKYNDVETFLDKDNNKKITKKIGEFYDNFDTKYQDDDFKMKEYGYQHDNRDIVGVNKRKLFSGEEVYNIVYTEWKEETIANQGMRKFTQEFGNQFLSSADSMISGEAIRDIETLKPVPVHECEPLYSTFMSISGRLDEFTRIFKVPEEEHEYVIGVDPAKVTEVSDGDSLAIQVLDITNAPIEQVATIEIPTGISYTEVHEVVASIGRYYNEAYLFIENNDQTGLLILDKLLQLEEYENIYSEVAGTSGFRTTAKNKTSNVLRVKDLIENKKLLIRDKHTVSQISVFIKKGGKFAAESGFNDDLVMALIHACFYLTDLMVFEEAVDNMERFGVSKYRELADHKTLLKSQEEQNERPDLDRFENAPMPMGSAADFEDEEQSVF